MELLVDHQIDLSLFKSRYHNDATGAPAYDSAILLKIILCAYACGIISSRRIAQCCRENMIFMALAAGSEPHFTTLAHVVSSLSQEIGGVVRDVLWVCDELGLIGKEVFAVDPSKSGPD